MRLLGDDPGAVNRPPIAAGDQYTVGEHEVLAIGAPGVLGNDTDADGDLLVVSAVNG